jgi:hypothetical protein
MISDAKRKRPDDDPDEDDDELTDGTTMRVRMQMMDQKVMWARPITDAAPSIRDAQARAREARDQMITDQAQAWKMGRDVELPPLRRPSNLADAQAAARLEYTRMCARLQDAWRRPVNPNSPTVGNSIHDGAEPDLSSYGFKVVTPQQFAAAYNRTSPGPGTDDPNELRRRADEAYEERNRLQREAWRNPGNPAAAANEVEAQRRRWIHENRR